MRLRTVPQPRLRLRNRLKIALLSSALGAAVLLAVWVVTTQSEAEPHPSQPYPLPVTLILRPQLQQEQVPASKEIALLQEAFGSLEQDKAQGQEIGAAAVYHRQQLQVLREIEDHEMRLALRASRADFDPEPYRSKINLLRARLSRMAPPTAHSY